MAKALLFIMITLLVCSSGMAEAQPSDLPQVVVFRLIDQTELQGVTVSVSSGTTSTILTEAPLDDGRQGFTHREPAKWPTDVTFFIKIPARASSGSLTRNLSPSTVVLGFSVRPVFDPQIIEIPIKLISSVSQSDITRVLRMGDGDALEKLVLVQQEFSAWSMLSQNDALTKDIAREWHDTIFRSITTNSHDLVVPLRFDRSVQAAIAAAFSDNRTQIATQFEPRVQEVEDRFWRIPGQFRLIVDTKRCDVAMDAARFVIEKHFNDPLAAGRTGISSPREQIARMVGLLKPECDASNPDSLLAKFDAEEDDT